MDGSFIFNIQKFSKLTEWFLYTRLFDSHIWARWYWTVVIIPFTSGDNFHINNNLIMLLIVTFVSRFNDWLMFSRHLCSYKTLLLNDWYTPLVNICYFRHSDRNELLRMTYWSSNDSILRTGSITLVIDHDLAHCSDWSVLLSVWKQICSVTYLGSFDLSYELCYCVDIAVNYIPVEYGQLLQWNCDCFSGGFKRLWVVTDSDIII